MLGTELQSLWPTSVPRGAGRMGEWPHRRALESGEARLDTGSALTGLGLHLSESLFVCVMGMTIIPTPHRS